MYNNFRNLKEVGVFLENKYSNIRFLFEIDFSRDDYIFFKTLFQNDVLIISSRFEKDFFCSYFRNHPHHRLPFLLLIIGFVRYEYLDAKNSANFFHNFLENILCNKIATGDDFRNALINYFFKWKGISSFETEGLYIFEIQTNGVSLKLKDCGKNKYLNTFLFHAGCICDNDDLKDYFKVLKFLNENTINSLERKSILKEYKNINFPLYNRNIEKFFDLLENEEAEISSYFLEFIKQSIFLIRNESCNNKINLPIYIRNYLLFNSIYGKEINKINLLESDFSYQNQEIVFKPTFKEIYNEIESLSFKIYSKLKMVIKEYDNYVKSDFNDFYFKIENPLEPLKIEMFINNILFKSFEINLYKHKFILLDNDFVIKSLNNRREIDIPKGDEKKKYFIITEEQLVLERDNSRSLPNLNFYVLPLSREISTISIDNIDYEIYYQSKLETQIEYKDTEFIFLSQIPTFLLSNKDRDRFEAIDIFSGEKLDFNKFNKFSNPIGKFEVLIGTSSYKVIIIKGFEIIEWFNWYDKEKIIKVVFENKEIKTNHTYEEIIDERRVLSFDIDKLTEPILNFNQINGNNIHINIQKPEIELFLIDKRKNLLKVQSKQNNIKLNKLEKFRKLKIVLKNFPLKIRFDKVSIFNQDFDLFHSNNEYTVSIKELMQYIESVNKSNFPLKLKNRYNYLNIGNIINNTLYDKLEENKHFMRIDDINFLMLNHEYMKVYIQNKPYYINCIKKESHYGFIDYYIHMEEYKKTKKENKDIKPFKQIEKNGLYVDMGEIEYE